MGYRGNDLSETFVLFPKCLLHLWVRKCPTINDTNLYLKPSNSFHWTAWKIFGKYPTYKRDTAKRWCIPQIPGSNKPSGQWSQLISREVPNYRNRRTIKIGLLSRPPPPQKILTSGKLQPNLGLLPTQPWFKVHWTISRTLDVRLGSQLLFTSKTWHQNQCLSSTIHGPFSIPDIVPPHHRPICKLL